MACQPFTATFLGHHLLFYKQAVAKKSDKHQKIIVLNCHKATKQALIKGNELQEKSFIGS